MEKENSIGLRIIAAITVIIRMVKNMDMGNTIGHKQINIKEIGIKIKWMDKECIDGMMENNIVENGWMVKCMEKENWYIQMAKVMRVCSKRD